MDGILARSQHANKSNRAERNDGNRPNQVETAGSLALWQQGLLMANLYDSFVSDNPFAVDYSAFGFEGDADAIAYGGFLSSFSNAVSTLGGSSFGGFSDGGFSSFSSGGGFASVGGGGGFSGGGGGFASVC